MKSSKEARKRREKEGRSPIVSLKKDSTKVGLGHGTNFSLVKLACSCLHLIAKHKVNFASIYRVVY